MLPHQLEAKAAQAERFVQSGQTLQASRLFLDILQEDPTHARAAYYLAMTAFTAGNLDDARRYIEQAMAGTPPTAIVDASGGQILAACGEVDAAVAAYERALAKDPDFLPARLDAGQLLESQGRTLEANQHFRTALQQAGKHPTLPAALQAPLERARAAVQAEQAQLELQLQAAMKHAGMDTPADSSARFEECYEILMGRQRVHWPKPGFMHFPKLPPLTFYGREHFPWAEALEARTAAIRAEALAVMASAGDRFIAYVQKPDAEVPDSKAWRDLNKNDDWGAYFLHNQGERVERNCTACPETVAALDLAPLVRIPGRGPTAFLSRLRPGAYIPPHHGATNTRLIAHLPLIIPRDCAIRVGNDTRTWREGELIVFDDTVEHEAWNRSDETRLVLIFDIWNPFLSEAERQGVTAVTAAYAAFYPDRLHKLD
jgi:aspartyl/asparaginyl beta-hydroxylase (cupin superfamily)/Tfp pilus assembly protein PilF